MRPTAGLAVEDAWWTAVASVTMIDGEPRQVDALLAGARRVRFASRRLTAFALARGPVLGCLPAASHPQRSLTCHRSIFAARLLAHVQASGGDAAALRRSFALPEQDGEAGLVVKASVVAALARAAAEMLGDPDVGLHAGASTERGSFDIVEFAGRSAPNIGGALERLARYGRLLSPRATFSLKYRGGDGVLGHRLLSDDPDDARHATEFTFAALVQLCRQFAAGPCEPHHVRFAHPAPDDRRGLQRFFVGATLEFGCDESSLSFSPAALMVPLTTSDSALLRVLDRYAQTSLRAAPPGEDLSARVRVQLRERLGGGPPAVGEVARALGLSARTLQRRLAESGRSFAEVVDDLRRELALQYVSGTDHSLAEIAFMLGYSDVRAFIRAFKRWTGAPPGARRSPSR